MSRAKKTKNIAFLFNADEKSFNGWYGEPCENELLKLLFLEDKENTCTSLLLRGDLMIYMLAQEYRAVSRGRDSNNNRTSSTAIGVNSDMHSVIFWDFIDTISYGWHTTSDETLPLAILRQNTYVINLPTLPENIISVIDCGLKDFPAYYGAIEVDSGNPVHEKLFAKSLIDDAFIKEGKIYSTKDTEDIRTNFLCSGDDFLKTKLIRVYEEDFSEIKPKKLVPYKHSERGLITKATIDNESKESHYQNLAKNLVDISTAGKDGPDFEFVIPEGFEKVIISEEKLVSYILNKKHPNGGHKAKLFEENLGITAKEWRYLVEQITKNLPTVELHKTRITEYGIQYHAIVPIVGKNGVRASVLTAWIVEGSSNARLITAYIASKKEQVKYQ